MQKPESRRLQLNRGQLRAWIVYGYKLTSPDYGNGKPFNKDAAAALNSHQGQYVERDSAFELPSVVALGSLLPDQVLQPGETTARTVIFHVQRGKYDVLESHALMPSAALAGRIELEWTLDEQSGLKPVMYRISSRGERKLMEENKNGGYSDERLGLQQATSMSQLSLWDCGD